VWLVIIVPVVNQLVRLLFIDAPAVVIVRLAAQLRRPVLRVLFVRRTLPL
jgi:hypothetical protein